MEAHYIYALIDPRTNQIRYIGKALNPESRLYDHVRHICNDPNKHKARWIKQLLDRGLLPIIGILEICSKEEWPIREKYWVKFHKDLGYKLTNITDGGEGIAGFAGRKHKQSTKRLLSVINVNKKRSEEAIEKMKLAQRKRYEEHPEQLEELKERMRKLRYRSNNTKEQNEKISKSLLKYYKNNGIGRQYKHNDETVEKMRKSQQERFKNPEERAKMKEYGKLGAEKRWNKK